MDIFFNYYLKRIILQSGNIKLVDFIKIFTYPEYLIMKK